MNRRKFLAILGAIVTAPATLLKAGIAGPESDYESLKYKMKEEQDVGYFQADCTDLGDGRYQVCLTPEITKRRLGRNGNERTTVYRTPTGQRKARMP